MTANAGYHAYATGDVLTAAQVQYNLQNQTTMYFASASARTTALSGVLVEGMVSYIPANGIEYYNGSAWVSVSQAVTALTTKGDLLTYSTQDTRLPVGSDGQTLVANSSAATGLSWQPNTAAGKNLVINGGFDIWQRGTSSTSQGYQTADRWYNTSSAATTTFSQESTIVPSGSLYSMKVAQVTSAAQTDLNCAIETLNAIRFAGQTVTLSFKAAATASTNVYAKLYYSTSSNVGPTGSWTAITATSGGTGTVTTTASFTTISGVFAVPSTAKSLLVVIGTGSIAAGQSWYAGQVQLEAGSVATAFQTATGTVQGELAACQRYYWRVANGASGAFMNAHYYSTTQINGTITYPVTMRTTPTLDSITGTGYYLMIKTGSNNSLNSFTLGSDTNSSTGSIFNSTQATGVAGYAGYLYSGNAAAYVGFSAEL